MLKTGSVRHTDLLRVAKEQADLNACQTPADFAVARQRLAERLLVANFNLDPDACLASFTKRSADL